MTNIEKTIETSLNKNHITVINELNKKGYKAYIVGGTVRDVVLGKENKDVDIATSATPQEVMEVFKNFTTIDVGNEHGTVPVIVNHEQIEVTTFRHDGDYSDGRRPDSVTFTRNLKDDVVRRDFTINALAYSKEDGVVDYVGGLKDIENKLIKAVGSAEERFNEDPLRILRGLRFASKLGFSIETKTAEAMFANKHLLKNVSKERIQKEFNGLLMGADAKTILMDYKEVLAEIIPGIKPMFNFDQKNPNHIYDVWEHTVNVVQNAKQDPAHKIAAVYHDSGKPATFKFNEQKGTGQFFGHSEVSAEIAKKSLKELKYPNKLIERVVNIIIDHDENLSLKPYKIKKAIYGKGVSRFFDMLDIKTADDSAKSSLKMKTYTNYEKAREIAEEYLSGTPILTHKDTAIEAKDIIELGFKGKEIQETLDKVAFAVMGGTKNEKSVLIDYVKKVLKK